MEYKGTYLIEYELVNLTGLRIGGSKEEFEIGGIDNPVIKLPVSMEYNHIPKGVPYIPGSSLKGKIRSLLEWVLGRVDPNGEPCKCGECEVCKVFGAADTNVVKQKKPGPPRAKFSDAYPSKKSIEMLQRELGEGLFTEIKTENRINRITAVAQDPRKMERVPPGVEFVGRVSLDLFGEEEKFLLLLLRGFLLLEHNFLGGCGSRGYGRVKFKKLKVYFLPREYFMGTGNMKRIGEFDSVEEALSKIKAGEGNGKAD